MRFPLALLCLVAVAILPSTVRGLQSARPIWKPASRWRDDQSPSGNHQGSIKPRPCGGIIRNVPRSLPPVRREPPDSQIAGRDSCAP